MGLRRNPYVEARTSSCSLPQRERRFAGDRNDDLGEDPVVLELVAAILGALRGGFRPRARLVGAAALLLSTGLVVSADLGLR
jgi:hypothetical protein